jgi:SAM-dependent methyltransferase
MLGSLFALANESTGKLFALANESTGKLLALANESTGKLFALANESTGKLFALANESTRVPAQVAVSLPANTRQTEPMLPANLTEAQIYRHVHQLLNDHEKMLGDSTRNRAFFQALQAHVTTDSVVLDIGAGFGVWAITAAKLGAKKVVALDSNELLMGVIKQLAKECGVEDRVEPICGYSTDVALAREFDIVVSETIGFDGFDEAIVTVMSDARRRFLKPGGVLIPGELSLWCAAGHWQEKPLPQALPFAFTHFNKLNRNAPLRLHDGIELALLTPPKQLISANLYHAHEPFDLTQLRAEWPLSAAANAANCVLVWVQSQLSDNVLLSTRETTSWTPLLYRFERSESAMESLAFTVAFAPETPRWQVTHAGVSGEQTRHYSPKLAAQSILRDLGDGELSVSALGMQLIDALAGKSDSGNR